MSRKVGSKNKKSKSEAKPEAKAEAKPAEPKAEDKAEAILDSSDVDKIINDASAIIE